jgi:hypothetical protein
MTSEDFQAVTIVVCALAFLGRLIVRDDRGRLALALIQILAATAGLAAFAARLPVRR